MHTHISLFSHSWLSWEHLAISKYWARRAQEQLEAILQAPELWSADIVIDWFDEAPRIYEPASNDLETPGLWMPRFEFSRLCQPRWPPEAI